METELGILMQHGNLLILFKNGVVLDKVISFQPKEALTELILKHS